MSAETQVHLHCVIQNCPVHFNLPHWSNRTGHARGPACVPNTSIPIDTVEIKTQLAMKTPRGGESFPNSAPTFDHSTLPG